MVAREIMFSVSIVFKEEAREDDAGQYLPGMRKEQTVV